MGLVGLVISLALMRGGIESLGPGLHRPATLGLMNYEIIFYEYGDKDNITKL